MWEAIDKLGRAKQSRAEQSIAAADEKENKEERKDFSFASSYSVVRVDVTQRRAAGSRYRFLL